MKSLSNWTAGAIAAAGLTLSAASPAVTNTPYGICAHVTRETAPTEFARMREAGIDWMRTDFIWQNVERKPGEWNFSHLDTLVEQAKKEGIRLLPILDYDTTWATPAWKHPDAWSEYVSRTVGRYAEKLRYWEVWNEQNSQKFWRDAPNGANYASLLERTFQEIKRIDPELTVLYGGTAHVPLGFIEDSLKAGAGKYFDVMNIHPYHWQGIPELMIPELNDLKTLMRKYGIGDKPVWITEVGWATAQPAVFLRDMLPSVLDRAGIDASRTTAAILRAPESGLFGELNFDPAFHLPGFKSIETVRLPQLAGLDVKQYPVLIPALGEEFPAPHIPELVDYVKRGGTLLLPSGLPFYYDVRPDDKGGFQRIQVKDRFLKEFHIGWDAWWTQEGVPQQVKYQKPAPEFAGKFEVDFLPTGRFLHERNLKPGDEFIPVIEAGTDRYKGAVAALYKLNSDLKGNVIVCTKMPIDSVSEASQAELLPRTYLVALANGVERIFWYKSHSRETRPDEREAHFGILRKDYSPKPSFDAYRTLTRLCPSGSTVPELRRSGSVYLAGWTRPDGVKTWAIWTTMYPEKIRLDIRGSLSDTQNHLGGKLPPPEAEFTVGPGPLYLIGPESVTFR